MEVNNVFVDSCVGYDTYMYSTLRCIAMGWGSRVFAQDDSDSDSDSDSVEVLVVAIHNPERKMRAWMMAQGRIFIFAFSGWG